MELAKQDLHLTRGERAFRVRAYLDNQDPLGVGWHTIIVENRTPVSHDLPIARDAETCLSAAVRFVNGIVGVDRSVGESGDDRGVSHAGESEGGAALGADSASLRVPSHAVDSSSMGARTS